MSPHDGAVAADSAELIKVQSTVDKHYDFPLWRKCCILFATSWVALAATFSSTSLVSASQEIAANFNIQASAVDASNASVLFAMGLSTLIWGPVQSLVGRGIAYNACILTLALLTMGSALSPSFGAFVALRVLSGFQGTYFHVSGQAILADYFAPVQRGTATGFFLSGTVLGPPLGPCIAGIIVNFASWRIVLWLQVAMAGMGLVMSLVFIPFEGPRPTSKQQAHSCNPIRIFRLMAKPSILFTDIACGLLSWSQYSLLSAPRQIFTTRFGLQSPLTSGLFYISPAVGFLIGTIVGGRWSDYTVKKWISRRLGVRLPRDRLKSSPLAFFVVLPAASLIYGWCLQCGVGGLVLPIAMAFFVALGLLVAFASLNTYCSEIIPVERQSVISGKYVIQYTFGAAATVASVPIIEKVGVGSLSTINTAFVVLGGVLTFVTATEGRFVRGWAQYWASPGRKSSSDSSV